MTETHKQRVERLARAAYEGATYWCAENDQKYHEEADPYEGQIADFCRALARAIIASDHAAGYVTVPVDLLKDCADDLEAWVRFAYPEDSRKYPSEARRYVRDMKPTVRLRAAIAAHEQEERQDAP